MVRQKILALASMMQYDDDVDESQVTATKQAQSELAERQAKSAPVKAAAPEEVKREESDEEEDDFLMDDPAAFIERQASVENDMSNQFGDDPKAVARAKKLAASAASQEKSKGAQAAQTAQAP